MVGEEEVLNTPQCITGSPAAVKGMVQVQLYPPQLIYELYHKGKF